MAKIVTSVPRPKRARKRVNGRIPKGNPLPTTPLAQATRLVASIEAAQRTGQGDIRSNEVVEKLLVIARMWIAERTAPFLSVAAQPPVYIDAGIHGVARAQGGRMVLAAE
jgi:hypothetical protein